MIKNQANTQACDNIDVPVRHICIKPKAKKATASCSLQHETARHSCGHCINCLVKQTKHMQLHKHRAQKQMQAAFDTGRVASKVQSDADLEVQLSRSLRETSNVAWQQKIFVQGNHLA